MAFYQNTIECIEKTQFKPKWSKFYPNIEFIETCIEKREMFVCTKDDSIISCVVLNNRFNPEYENINWTVDVKPCEIIIIHAFAVSPDFTGKGIGKEIFNQIKENAIKNNKKQ